MYRFLWTNQSDLFCHYFDPPAVRIIRNTETTERLGFTAHIGSGEIAAGLEVGDVYALIGADIETAEAAFCKSVFVQVERENDRNIVLVGNTHILYVWSTIICHRTIARVTAGAA